MESASPSQARSATNDSPRSQLLIVDPDPTVTDSNDALRSTFRIAVARCVNTARRFIQQFPPDLIITEMQFDDGTGTDICRQAKSLVTPAAVLVTTEKPDVVPDAILAGCDGVLLKPFAPNLLHARIGRILRLRAKSRHLRAQSDALLARFEGQRSKLQHLRDRGEHNRDRTIVEWPTAHCPYCRHIGVTSFDFSSMRRAWYACLECKKVWLAKRQE